MVAPAASNASPERRASLPPILTVSACQHGCSVASELGPERRSCLICCFDELLGSIINLSHHIGLIEVPMVALEVGSHINIDDVTILQDPFVWDAMTYDLHSQMDTAQPSCWAPPGEAALRHQFVAKQSKPHAFSKAVQRDCAAQSLSLVSGCYSGTKLTCQFSIFPAQLCMKEINCEAPVSPHLRMCTPTWGSSSN